MSVVSKKEERKSLGGQPLDLLARADLRQGPGARMSRVLAGLQLEVAPGPIEGTDRTVTALALSALVTAGRAGGRRLAVHGQTLATGGERLRCAIDIPLAKASRGEP